MRQCVSLSGDFAFKTMVRPLSGAFSRRCSRLAALHCAAPHAMKIHSLPACSHSPVRTHLFCACTPARRSDTRVSYLTLFSPVGRGFLRTHKYRLKWFAKVFTRLSVCVCLWINFSLLSNTHSPLAAESFAFDEFRRYCVWRTKSSKALAEKSVCLLH